MVADALILHVDLVGPVVEHGADSPHIAVDRRLKERSWAHERFHVGLQGGPNRLECAADVDRREAFAIRRIWSSPAVEQESHHLRKHKPRCNLRRGEQRVG